MSTPTTPTSLSGTSLPLLVDRDSLTSVDDESYDGPRQLAKYLLMHYGTAEETFPDPRHVLASSYGFVQRLSNGLHLAAAEQGSDVARALDVGCSVGGLTTVLASWVTGDVVGIDVSEASVEVARRLADAGGGAYDITTDGAAFDRLEIRLDGGLCPRRFEVGDASAISLPDEPYDAIVLSNVLDRVPDPADCLRQFTDERLLRRGGFLMIACPWSWYPTFSEPDKWLGDPDGTTAQEQLSELLLPDFDLVRELETSGVLRQNIREYDYFDAHTSIWMRHR